MAEWHSQVPSIIATGHGRSRSISIIDHNERKKSLWLGITAIKAVSVIFDPITALLVPRRWATTGNFGLGALALALALL
jgi:hypothetical protein